MRGEDVGDVGLPLRGNETWIGNAAEGMGGPLGGDDPGGERRRRRGGLRAGRCHTHAARGLVLENPGELRVGATGGQQFQGSAPAM